MEATLKEKATHYSYYLRFSLSHWHTTQELTGCVLSSGCQQTV